MKRTRLRGAVLAATLCGLAAVDASAQSMGTFRWQLQPYCNVVALAATRNGPVYRLEGVDEQCGATERGAAMGTAFANPDGTIGLGFVLVSAPGGPSVAVDAVISLASLSGTWRDQFGHAGSFALTAAAGSGGEALPFVLGVPITGVAAGPGVAASLSGGRLDLAVAYGSDGAASSAAHADHSHSVRSETNTGAGPGALDAARATTSSAFNNTAIGAAALRATSTGSENTAIGVLALSDNVGGGLNVAVGANAMIRADMAHGNVAIGASTLTSGTSSTANVAIGKEALFSTSNGVGNVAIGLRALWRNDGGHTNVAIGADAGSAASPDASNGIYIGSPGEAAAVATTRIGRGTHVAAYIAGIAGTTVAGGVPVVTSAEGRMGTLVSSARLKRDIQPLPDLHERLARLRPVEFVYTAAAGGDGREVQYGLLAEEVAVAFPELVVRDAGGRPWAVRYQLLGPLLVAEVQRLEQERRRKADRLERIAARLRQLLSTGGQP